MGTKRVGLARVEALIENLSRDLAVSSTSFSALKGLAGAVAATVTAAGSAAALTEALICPVDSANNAHKVKMFNASYAGQIVIVINVDTGQDAVVRDVGDANDLLTLGEGVGCILVSTATGDNWFPVALGS